MEDYLFRSGCRAGIDRAPPSSSSIRSIAFGTGLFTFRRGSGGPSSSILFRWWLPFACLRGTVTFVPLVDMSLARRGGGGYIGFASATG